MRRRYIKAWVVALLMTCAAPAMAQNKVVQGTVLDDMGEPVIGATVRVAGTKNAAVTDMDGNYKISVPKGGKIVVSYIGFKDTPTNGGTMKMEAEDKTLQEVVVVGYGTQKKAHLTGAVASVPTDEIQDLANGGLASTLGGLVNGLSVSGGDGRPGENATLSIRDTKSLGDIGSTAQQPLFVIDGYIYPNDIKVGNSTQNLGAEAFNNLDPAEVESISVLKDASAAVYGARAANGVILVTTKKGKIGAPTISYNGTIGFTDEVARPKMLSAYNYGRLYNAVAAADPTNTSLNHTTQLYQADELEAMKNLNYDLLDKYWSTGVTQKHGVNVSGATDRVNYFGGISYFTQDGNLGKLDYSRWNYRAGVDVKITKYLNASINVSGDYGTKNKPLVKVGGSGDEKDYNILLTRPTYIPESIGGYDLVAAGISNDIDVNKDMAYNFATLQNNGDYSKTMNSNININGSLNFSFDWWKPLKGLTARFSYSRSIYNSKTNEYGSSYTLYSLNKRYGSGMHLYTPTSGDEEGFNYLDASNLNQRPIANGNYLARMMTRTDNYQMNFTLQYSRDFGLHHVGGLFSIEKSEAESEYLQGQRESPYEFTTGQYNSATGTMTTQFTRSESGTLSYIFRANYAYANKYLFEALVRSDASTKFAPKNYWGTFPSFSAGWVISEENWFKPVKFVDFLKIRASWGLTGRDNTNAWQWMQVYALDANKGSVFGTGTTNSSGNRITINKNNASVNSDVHWDKDYKTNIGFDAKFLNNRLSLTFDWYYEKNREMLMKIAQAVPSTVGTQSAATNLGEMNSWGGEVSITWRDKIGKDFSYKVGLNTGWSDNEVLNMDWANDYLYRQIQQGGRTDVGVWGMECIGMFRSFQDIEEYFTKYNITTYMGMTKDQVRPGMLMYKDVRGAYNEATGTYDGPDGIVDANNDQVQLSTRSSNIYGMTMNLSCEWKGISLTAQLGANWGGYVTLPTAALKPTNGLEYTNMPSFWNVDNMFSYQDVYDGSGNLVVAKNLEGYYPNLAYSSVNAVASSFWRVSNTRVTLNRLTIAYSLPKMKWMKSVGLKSFRVNVTGQNLINFYNPYPDSFTNAMAGTYGSYPNLRKWTIGFNLSF